MKYEEGHKTLSSFMEKCISEKLNLPENPYDAMQEVSSALKQSQGKEQEAMELLKKRLTGTSNKRSAPESFDEFSDEDELHHKMPPHKRTRLIEEARSQPARVPANQKIVDAFVDYAQKHLDQGHTGKFVSHVRAANYIRDYDEEIKSGWQAKRVGYVGNKMASQVEEILKTGKFSDETPNKNVTRDYDHELPQIVTDIRDSPAKCKENQKIVDALTDFGEYHLKYGNTGKGTSHLRAAKQIHEYDKVVDSGYYAESNIGYIGSHIADKIDQILKHGKIVHDEETPSSHRIAGDPAPIVQDLKQNKAKRPENERIVAALTSYGDAHLRGGHRGKGISHLRAAVEIRNSDIPIKSAADAKQIPMVGKRVAKKIDQILQHGHADSDEDYVEGEEEEEEEEEGEGEEIDVEEQSEQYGRSYHGHHPTPLMMEVRNTKAKCRENQKIIDALADYAENKLDHKDTGRAVTYLRAARELANSSEVIKSANQAKKIGMIGNKVAKFIEETLKSNK